MPKGVRASDQTSISFSCSRKLREEIGELAKAEKRSRSNWLRKELEQIIAEQKHPTVAIVTPPSITQGNFVNYHPDDDPVRATRVADKAKPKAK